MDIIRISPETQAIAQQLFLMLQQVFDVERPTIPPVSYIKELLENPHFIGLAAVSHGQAVGGLIAYELPMYYRDCSEVYVYDIAVDPAYQRQGVGRALLSGIKTYCAQNGIADLFVDASEADVHALDFYRSVHGREERVVQFSYVAAPTGVVA